LDFDFRGLFDDPLSFEVVGEAADDDAAAFSALSARLRSIAARSSCVTGVLRDGDCADSRGPDLSNMLRNDCRFSHNSSND
jgi:hypothetical protein